MQTILNNPLATPFTLAYRPQRLLALRAGDCVGDRYSRYSCRPVYPGHVHLCALSALLPADGITRWTGVAASECGVVRYCAGIHLNALVAIMQFVLMKIRCRGWYSGRWGALGPRVVEKIGRTGRGVCIASFCALRSARQLTALRLGEERAMSFGIHVRRLRLLSSLLRISLLSALTVAFVGPIGFIESAAPHIARILWGRSPFLPSAACS
ncbi:iron chelate uptake ABC transporter family permease subunit [Salmonella enterica subsp. enterica]|nr:iron chelate uptake ABC transporter family permease subunit [Salmonella enterica subsp. enterica]